MSLQIPEERKLKLISQEGWFNQNEKDAMPKNHIVKSYDEDLTHLKDTLFSMAHLVQEQFREALLSLEKQDKSLAKKLIARDEEIDKLEILIDRISLQILALRQPVAFDLRLVIAALKMANHLERMGDYATNIARRVLVLEEMPSLLVEPFLSIFRMGDLIRSMMIFVNDGFRTQNQEVMEQVWQDDQKVDQLYGALLRELLAAMVKEPESISLCTHYLFIAKNIERVGDHVTNLGEIVTVMVRGKPLKEMRRRPIEETIPKKL